MLLSIGGSGECRCVGFLEIGRVQSRGDVIVFCKPQSVRSIRIAAPHLTSQMLAFRLFYLLAPHTVMSTCWLGPGE